LARGNAVRSCPTVRRSRPRAPRQQRIDLLVGNQLVVELKAVKAFAPIDRAKVVSYLRATRCHLALLINFHVPALKDGVQRVIQS
jgi:GxxExxY protein